VWRNGPQTFLCKIKIGSTAKKPRLHNSTGKLIVVYFIVLQTLSNKQKTADNKSQAQIKTGENCSQNEKSQALDRMDSKNDPFFLSCEQFMPRELRN
jgi:hypothetical protein